MFTLICLAFFCVVFHIIEVVVMLSLLQKITSIAKEIDKTDQHQMTTYRVLLSLSDDLYNHSTIVRKKKRTDPLHKELEQRQRQRMLKS